MLPRILISPHPRISFFFFNDTATTEIYTLSLHDALPIFEGQTQLRGQGWRQDHFRQTNRGWHPVGRAEKRRAGCAGRSEEHTSELQSRLHLVCRLLLEKKKEVGQPRRGARGRTTPQPYGH